MIFYTPYISYLMPHFIQILSESKKKKDNHNISAFVSPPPHADVKWKQKNYIHDHLLSHLTL